MSPVHAIDFLSKTRRNKNMIRIHPTSTVRTSTPMETPVFCLVDAFQEVLRQIRISDADD